VRRLKAPPEPPPELAAGLAAIREELDVPGEFPAEALREAKEAAQAPLPERADRREIELFTIDPPGSMDLDQAMALEPRPGGGYRIHYAIADVAAFVKPGGALDAEAHRRVLTRYLPDGNAPLHPRVLSEGAASLLPGEDRPAVLWTIELDGDSERTSLDVRRALVRSRERLDYPTADRTRGDERLELLREIGGLLQERERARGAISLPIPEQEVVLGDDGYALAYRGPLPIEDANAQISLLTGMCAAELMLAAGVGVLRTLPVPEERQVERLRRVAEALAIDWPRDERAGDLVRRLDPLRAREAAFLEESASLLRGAGYASFHGAPPAGAWHGGLAAPYAHVTAPLRRLADRYAAEACLAATPPAWLLEALPRLPEEMAAGGRAAATIERASVDLVEALLLEPRVGEHFEAMAIDRMGRAAVEVQLADPAVRARCEGAGLEPGRELTVRLVEADPRRRVVRFATARIDA
jgi:exoribonuclease R